MVEGREFGCTPSTSVDSAPTPPPPPPPPLRAAGDWDREGKWNDSVPQNSSFRDLPRVFLEGLED